MLCDESVSPAEGCCPVHDSPCSLGAALMQRRREARCAAGCSSAGDSSLFGPSRGGARHAEGAFSVGHGDLGVHGSAEPPGRSRGSLGAGVPLHPPRDLLPRGERGRRRQEMPVPIFDAYFRSSFARHQ